MSILWNFDKYAKIEELPYAPSGIGPEMGLQDLGNGVFLLKEGTPLGFDPEAGVFTFPLGRPVSTLDAFYFAAEDYHFILTNAQQPKLVECVTKGYVEKAKVREAVKDQIVEGGDLPDDWDEFLATEGLYLIDDLGNLPGGSGGGSSGGGILTVTGTYGETAFFGEPGYTLDKTYAEIHAALEAKTPVFVWQNESAVGGPGMICLLATESYYYNEAYLIDAGNPGTGSSNHKRIQYFALSESDYPVGAYGKA